MSGLFHIAASWRRSLRRAQATKLIVLACLTGAITGAATVAFVELINLVQWAAIGSADLPLRVLANVPWYRVLLAPVLGGLILGPMVAFLAPEAEGHGVPEVIEAVMLTGGRIRRRVAAVKSLASAITVMIVATVATMVGRALKEDSLYTLKLSRCGIALSRREDLIMRSHTVGQVMRPAPPVLEERTSIADTVQYFLEHEIVNAYVADAEGRFVGAISIHDIKDPSVSELGPLVVAHEVADPNVHTAAPEDTLADCIDQFILSNDDELPVVAADGKLVGVVSRRDVLRIYSSELLRHEYLGVATRDAGARRYPQVGRNFAFARVTTPAWLAGRSLREANLRAAYNLTVVAVRHGADGEDRLPDPAAPLQTGDVFVVGTAADLDRFQRATGLATATGEVMSPA